MTRAGLADRLFTIGVPLGALVFALAAMAMSGGTLLTGLAALVVLLVAVFASVHHAEIIAHHTGEPYGTLVLTVTVTIIEVALIVSVQLGGSGGETLARDTVFSVVMIVCNGLIGACILIGGLRYGEPGFRVTGANAYLAVLAVLATLTLLMPNYTQTTLGPVFSLRQLGFISLVTLALYTAFLYIQTVRHRDYFTLFGDDAAEVDHGPGSRAALVSAVLLVAALTGIVLLSKKVSALLDAGVEAAGLPRAVSGVAVALLILLPESVAAIRAAKRNELQKCVNLALGSSLATIGLTVPAVAALSIYLQHNLVLGLSAKDSVLLALTMIVSLLTFGTGRTNMLYGFVHLVLFATFLFLVFEP